MTARTDSSRRNNSFLLASLATAGGQGFVLKMLLLSACIVNSKRCSAYVTWKLTLYGDVF